MQRPYSVASDPPSVADSEGYEMYVRLVPGAAAFTTLLWRLPLGHRMRMIGPKGPASCWSPHDERTHLFVSTGHGHRAVHLDVADRSWR